MLGPSWPLGMLCKADQSSLWVFTQCHFCFSKEFNGCRRHKCDCYLMWLRCKWDTLYLVSVCLETWTRRQINLWQILIVLVKAKCVTHSERLFAMLCTARIYRRLKTFSRRAWSSIGADECTAASAKETRKQGKKKEQRNETSRPGRTPASKSCVSAKWLKKATPHPQRHISHCMSFHLCVMPPSGHGLMMAGDQIIK